MSEETYQVRTAMGQEQMVSKQTKTNVKIVGLNILHSFSVGKIAPNYILKSDFFAKISAKVDFKANKLGLYQRG